MLESFSATPTFYALKQKYKQRFVQIHGTVYTEQATRNSLYSLRMGVNFPLPAFIYKLGRLNEVSSIRKAVISLSFRRCSASTGLNSKIRTEDDHTCSASCDKLLEEWKAAYLQCRHDPTNFRALLVKVWCSGPCRSHG